MNDRDKLIELIVNADTYDSYECKLCTKNDVSCRRCGAKKFAGHLLANGVTVQECGHWVSYQSDEPYGCEDEKEWHKCSKCGNDAYGRCYEDEWYSAPILSAYCPHCGANMMLQPPKGE